MDFAVSKNQRRPIYLLAVVGLAFASAARADNLESADQNPPLTLIWYDSHDLLPFHFDRMTAEVGRIYTNAGMSVNWESGAEVRHDRADRNPLRINLVLLPSQARSWGLPESAMGVTTYEEGRKSSIYIFFPQVMRALGYINRATGYSPKISRDVALAIGRIISHEIVHYLAPYHPHGEKGLMRSRLNRSDLITEHVRLDPESVRVVRRELAAKANEARLMAAQ